MKMKKTEFSKKWLAACIIFSVGFTAASYVLAAFDKNPIETLSASIVETLWGASGVSFVGYALQNSVRAYTSSKFGIPTEAQETERSPPQEEKNPQSYEEIMEELDSKQML